METRKKPIGLLRIRNEALILQDTLDYMAEFCDGILVYDDASDDNSRNIYANHEAVVDYLRNPIWNNNQTVVQGYQRKQLFEYAKFKFPGRMYFYQDADERVEFDWEEWDGESSVIMKLYDARMTDDDQEPYVKGPLMNFRKFFDREAREIPFIFSGRAAYLGVDCERYPAIPSNEKIVHAGFVQHYGKALSKEHWQETCEYYAANIPAYAEKWEARKKESGVVSSEGLLTWEECKSQK